jgi:hypothetical protein
MENLTFIFIHLINNILGSFESMKINRREQREEGTESKELQIRLQVANEIKISLKSQKTFLAFIKECSSEWLPE